jgi:type I restriction enzyme M protein
LVDLPASNIISHISNSERNISEDGLKHSSAKLLPINTVIISSRATIGRIGINTIPVATNQGFKNIIIKRKDLVDTNFLAYMLTAKVDQMKQLASGGTFKEISKSNFEKIEIPLPPFEIQKQIIEELDGYKKIIDGAKQIVENWKPTFKINPKWEKVEIGNLAKVQGGFAFKSGDMTSDSEVQIIRIGNVQDQTFNIKRNPCFIEKSFYEKYENYQLHFGDILISMTGTNGKRDYGNVCIVDTDGKFLLNQLVGRVIPNSKILNNYLYLSLNQKETKDKFYQNSTGGIRQGNISSKQIESIKIPLPPIEEQKKIIDQIEKEKEMIDPLKNLIELYQEKINQKIKEVWDET